MEGKIDVHHVPFTRICVATMLTPVPFGTQIAWLSWSRSGIPLDRTRVAAVTHCAVTQGTGDPLTLNMHPAMVHGFGCCTVAWLETLTRGFGTVACACPVCMQSTVAP
jgi:hypothetical protein